MCANSICYLLLYDCMAKRIGDGNKEDDCQSATACKRISFLLQWSGVCDWYGQGNGHVVFGFWV